MLKIIKKNKVALNLFKQIRYHYFKRLSNRQLIEKRFKSSLGRSVNLDSPVLFNDKLQWLKLYWHDSHAASCADKYEVREFVKDRIGEEYLNELYGVYESVDDIDINALPKSFVLKGTNGSGDNILCSDKNQVNWSRTSKIMKKWFKRNLYWTTREWVYKDLQPRIICEKFMVDEKGIPPMDYKLFCFNGEPKLIQVDIDRFKEHKQNFYSVDWELQDITIDDIPTSNKNCHIEKPQTLEKMLELSRELSKGFPHVRVDFYNVKNQIIFGELTFFHRSGLGKFSSRGVEKKLGDYLKLPYES